LFLPAYSPELNPCDLVFEFIKSWIRRNRLPDPLWQQVMFVLAALNAEKVNNFIAKYREIVIH